MDFVCNEIRVDMWVHSPRSTILAPRKEIRWQERFRTIGFTWCCSTIPQTQAIWKCQHVDATWIWFWCCHHLEGCHTKANGFPPSRDYMSDYFLSGFYLLTNLACVTLLGAGWSRQYSSRCHWGMETLSPR